MKAFSSIVFPSALALLLIVLGLWYWQAPVEVPLGQSSSGEPRQLKPLTEASFVALQQRVQKRYDQWLDLQARENFAVDERWRASFDELEAIWYGDFDDGAPYNASEALGKERLVLSDTNVQWWRELDQRLTDHLSEVASYAVERNRLVAQRNKLEMTGAEHKAQVEAIDAVLLKAKTFADKGDFQQALSELNVR